MAYRSVQEILAVLVTEASGGYGLNWGTERSEKDEGIAVVCSLAVGTKEAAESRPAAADGGVRL
jgi:hypothetical protein